MAMVAKDVPITPEIRDLVQEAKRADDAIERAAARLRRMSERRRSAIYRLMDEHGMTARQAGELTGTTKGAILTARHRAHIPPRRGR